ncbi:S1 RNA-binding domain-containing protein, partial [Patescibacteria group bacterium]|nr:S1 RNA-binding domain-containing protein [Patescibacteria group bacterium]
MSTEEITKTEEEVIATTPTESEEGDSHRPKLEDLVEGPVIAVDKAAVYIDLAPYGTGVIYGREFIAVRDLVKKTNIGDIIKAKVVEVENENGYVELSLKEAKQALLWSEAERAIKDKTMFDLVIKEANKGGLIIDWQ